MTINFQFDAAVHAYVVDNQLQPHVTGILAQYGVIDYSGVPLSTLERKTLIGSLVHQITNYMDADGLPMDLAIGMVRDVYYENMLRMGVSWEDLAGYVIGWQRFLSESDFKILDGSCERRYVAEVNGMRYGMTIDRAGILRKKYTIIDLKCTAGREPSWPIQLSGYALGTPKPKGCARWDRAVVHLFPEGKYNLLPGGRQYTDRDTERRDEEVFLAALRLTWWKMENLGHV